MHFVEDHMTEHAYVLRFHALIFYNKYSEKSNDILLKISKQQEKHIIVIFIIKFFFISQFCVIININKWGE